MQLDWIEEKTGKPNVAKRVTAGGSWSITNPAVSTGGKWELMRETGQRKSFGEFDTLADAKATAAAHTDVAPEIPELAAK